MGFFGDGVEIEVGRLAIEPDLHAEHIFRDRFYIASATSGSDVLFTAPAGQDIIVSDVVLTGSGWGPTTANYKSCYFRARLTSSVAGLIGSFRFDSNHNNLNQPGYAAGTIQHAFSSGLVVPAGETLTLNWDTRYAICDMDWTITGYYAQP